MRTEWRTTSRVDRSYDLSACPGLLAGDHPGLLAGGRVPGRRFVVFDGGLPRELADRLRRRFQQAGITAEFSVLAGGRGVRSMDSVERLADEFLAFGLDRRTEPVIVVGGWSVTNVGSFAASIYRRGVPFLCVPTTPLALFVAIGLEPELYRSGVDDFTGRVGHPIGVALDWAFFASMPARAARAGSAEVLRAAIGRDAELFADLEQAAADPADRQPAGQEACDLLWRAVSGQVAAPGGTLADHVATWLGQAVLSASRGRLAPAAAVGAGVAAATHLALARGCLEATDGARILALTDRTGLLAGAVPELAGAVSAAFAAARPAGRVLVPAGTGCSVATDDVTPEEIRRAMTAVERGARCGRSG